jgi:uncharacterized protein YabN with tetrapyrrole methylase and pyrophosphatase domain
MMNGSLIVVGTGISVAHLSAETRGWISSSEKVLYCVADAASERLILTLNPNAESMYAYYGEGKNRSETYRQMVDRTLECVRSGQQVCVVYYGHPGIFVNPGHRAIELARAEGFDARMLPAVSSLDCLFCDLGFDPSGGCQMFEATDLIVRQKHLDVFSHVVVWQIASVGDLGFSFKGFDSRYVPNLVSYLRRYYSSEHEVVVYEAAQYPICEPVIKRQPLVELQNMKLSGIDTLYIPPINRAPIHIDALEEIGLGSYVKREQLIQVNGAENDFERQ